MPLSRYSLEITSAMLMAAVCIALLILAAVIFRKGKARFWSCFAFLISTSLYTGVRSIGIYLYAFDVAHHPSAQVSAFNLAAMLVSCPTVALGLLGIFQIRKANRPAV